MQPEAGNFAIASLERFSIALVINRVVISLPPKAQEVGCGTGSGITFGRFVRGEIGDFMAGRWGGRSNPLTTLQILTGPGGTYTPGGTVGSEYEAMLEAVNQYEFGDPQREVALRKAARYSAENVGNINFYTGCRIR
jgi:hypothetical protein